MPESENNIEKRDELLRAYVEAFGELAFYKELDEREYYVVMEAVAGLDRQQAQSRLEQFNDFLRQKLAEGGSSNGS